MSLADEIPDGADVLIDTPPVIYLLEDHPLGSRYAEVFAAIDAGRIRAVVTPITIAEVVGGPLRSGRDALAERYRRVLTTGPNWLLRPIDDEIAMLAARLRARHALKLPDALQAATAVTAGCHALVTHDRDLGAVADLQILSA